MLRHRPRGFCLALSFLVPGLLLAVQATPLGAQATTITLEGIITAEDGSVPEGAQLEVRSREITLARHTVAGPDGGYRILGLAPGLYDIQVRAIGYRQQRLEGVRLILGQRAAFDFKLKSGPVELEPIVVTAAPRFEVDRNDVSTTVLQDEIERLPLNSRNVLNVSAVAPGIRVFAVEAGRSAPAAGSLPVAAPRFANLYVDGLPWKGMYVGQVVGGPQNGSMIPQEAVREFRVYLNAYDAEYTGGASYIISAVTHRGSDQLEGSAFGFFQNKALVAKNTLESEEADYARYQIGGNLRGPLVRQRLFFALSYEGQVTDNFITVVPGRPPANPGIWDRYAGTFAAPSRLHTGFARLSAPLGSHTLDAIGATRYISSLTDFGIAVDGRMLSYDAGISTNSRVTSVQLRDTYTSRTLVNEASLHLLDLNNDQSLLNPQPTLQYPGIQTGRNLMPFQNEERHLRFINKTSLSLRGTTGVHLLKAGLEVTRVRVRVYRPFNVEGLFQFRADTSPEPFSAQIGLGVQDPGSTREGSATVEGSVLGGYLQDQWQPVPALTLTAGLRYDADINTLNQNLITPWANDTTLQRAVGEDFLNTGDRTNDLDNVAPRLSLTWDVLGNRRTFLRAGYGVMYDRVPLFGAHAEAIGVGWRIYSFASPGTTDPEELRRQVLQGADSTPQNVVLLKDHLETPANHEWSVGAGQQLTRHLAVNVDYMNQRVTNAPVTVTKNLRPQSGVRPLTNKYGNILLFDDFGDARFEAILFALTYDTGPTRLKLGYTLGWAKSEFGSFTNSDYPDSAAYSLQRSEADERHRFVLAGVARLPFDFELSGLAIVASPRPFLVTLGEDLNQNGSFSDDWPDGARTLRRDGWSHWYRSLDLRLGKSFAVPGGRLEITAEIFNLLSSANHSEYQPSQASEGYGEPVANYDRRQGQLGLRYQF